MEATQTSPAAPEAGKSPYPDGAFADRSLGEIAVALPAAIAVFRRTGLDFCCGGDVSLRNAAKERDLPLDALEAELGSLGARDNGEAHEFQSPTALIAHILNRFHAVHREEIPDLVALAKKVEAVHRTHAMVPNGLAAALHKLGDELETHMAKEELVLFPLMRQGGNPVIEHPIARMRHEHNNHGTLLRRVSEITHDLALPSDACNSWRALYAGIGKLVDDLMQHIHLENNVLFPQFAPQSAACGCDAGD
jgi:regulator of cell morphogenesis and NO signaling